MEDLIEKYPIRVLVLVSVAFVVALLWVPLPEAGNTKVQEKPSATPHVRPQADAAGPASGLTAAGDSAQALRFARTMPHAR